MPPYMAKFFDDVATIKENIRRIRAATKQVGEVELITVTLNAKCRVDEACRDLALATKLGEELMQQNQALRRSHDEELATLRASVREHEATHFTSMKPGFKVHSPLSAQPEQLLASSGRRGSSATPPTTKPIDPTFVRRVAQHRRAAARCGCACLLWGALISFW